MIESYLKRKDQMTNGGTPRQNVVDVGVELQKRSATPTPVSRNPVDVSNKKVIYKNDLENVKNELSNKHLELANKHGEILANVCEFKGQIDSLNKAVDSLNKTLDISKLDVLKANLNDSINKTNANLNSIADSLVNHLDKLNALDSRISAIESIL